MSNTQDSPSPDVTALIPKTEAKEYKAGKILASPHGRLTIESKKTALLSTIKFDKHVNEEIYIIEGNYALGLMKLNDPIEINSLEDFKSTQDKHQVSDEERKKWGKREPKWLDFPIYMYPITLVHSFPTPIAIKREIGPQVWIEKVVPVKELENNELMLYHSLSHITEYSNELVDSLHSIVATELVSRNLHLSRDNRLDAIFELIASWKGYNPLELIKSSRGKKVVADDHRIVHAWWTKLEVGKKLESPQFQEYNLEEQKKIVKELHDKITKAFEKLGWEHHSELTMHPSFARIYRKMVKKYGLERGERIYYSWVNKHGYDDTKPFPGSELFTLPRNMQVKDIDLPYIQKLNDKDLDDLHDYIHEEFAKVGLNEDLYNADVFIMTEMYKRDMIDESYEDKDKLDSIVRFSWQEYKTPASLEGYITKEEVLEAFMKAGLIPIKGEPFGSYLCGRVINEGKIPVDHDLDLVLRQDYDPRVLIAIKQLKPEWLAKRIHVVFDKKGPEIGYSIPIHGYSLNPLPKELMSEGYGPYRSKLSRSLEVFKPLIGVKPASGYGKNEFWDIKEAWEKWANEYIDKGINIEEKVDGRRFQLHYQKSSGKIKIYTEDRQRDRSDAFPEICEEIKKLPVETIILDGEMLVYIPKSNVLSKTGRTTRELGDLMPREDTASLTVGKVPDEIRLNIVYTFYDIMYLDGKELVDLPYSQRRERYSKLIGSKYKYLDYTRGEEAKSLREWFKLVSKYRSLNGSEGIVAKVSDFTYPVKFSGENRSKLMAKVKNLKEIDVIVLGIKQKRTEEGKALPTWMYESYFSLTPTDAKDFIPEDIKEYEGKIYAKIGMAYGTGKKARVGDIITVKPIRIRDLGMKGKRHVTWMFPYFKEIRTDKLAPDSITTVDRIIKLKTGPAPQKEISKMSTSEVEEYLESEKIVRIELDKCPWWNYLNVCPLRDRFYVAKKPQTLTRVGIEHLKFPVNCRLAYHYICHYLKDYYYGNDEVPIAEEIKKPVERIEPAIKSEALETIVALGKQKMEIQDKFKQLLEKVENTVDKKQKMSMRLGELANKIDEKLKEDEEKEKNTKYLNETSTTNSSDPNAK